MPPRTRTPSMHNFTFSFQLGIVAQLFSGLNQAMSHFKHILFAISFAFTGLICAVAVLVLGGGPGTSVLASGVLIVFLGFSIRNIRLFQKKRHLKREQSISASTNDTGLMRKTVYLRPFDADNWGRKSFIQRLMFISPSTWFSPNAIPGQELGAWLALIFKGWSSVVTVREPDGLPVLGPQSLRASDNWMAEVSQLIDEADLVVILLGSSPGVAFELREAIRLKRADQIVLCLGWAQASKNQKPFSECVEEVGIKLDNLLPNSLFATLSESLELVPVTGYRQFTTFDPFASFMAADGVVRLMEKDRPDLLRKIRINCIIVPIVAYLSLAFMIWFLVFHLPSAE
jgi:hypothetical protein